jgi:hypothetical protein
MRLFNQVCTLLPLLHTKMGTEMWHRLIQTRSIANKRFCDTDNTENNENTREMDRKTQRYPSVQLYTTSTSQYLAGPATQTSVTSMRHLCKMSSKNYFNTQLCGLVIYSIADRLCGLVVRVMATDPEVRVQFLALPVFFWELVGLERGSTQPRDDNWGAISWK